MSARAVRRPQTALSDLSVTEFLTLSRVGFLPHGLVIGSSIFDAGRASTRMGSTWSSLFDRQTDAVAIGNAVRVARATAVARMRQQAHDLGAEGVVGVRLTVEHHRWHGGHMVARFLAVGTAIGFDAAHAPREFAHAPSLHLADGGPFTSDLSGQDFVSLLRAGYRPVTVAIGNAVYAIDPTTLQRYRLSWANEEISEYTRDFFDARESAMNSLANEIYREFPAGHPDAPAGIVGMTVSEQAHPGVQGNVEFSAVGTAVAHVRADDPRKAQQVTSPAMVMPLDR